MYRWLLSESQLWQYRCSHADKCLRYHQMIKECPMLRNIFLGCKNIAIINQHNDRGNISSTLGNINVILCSAMFTVCMTISHNKPKIHNTFVSMASFEDNLSKPLPERHTILRLCCCKRWQSGDNQTCKVPVELLPSTYQHSVFTACCLTNSVKALETYVTKWR